MDSTSSIIDWTRRALATSAVLAAGLLGGCSQPAPSAAPVAASGIGAVRLLTGQPDRPGEPRSYPTALLASAVYEVQHGCLVLRDLRSGAVYTPRFPFGTHLGAHGGRVVLEHDGDAPVALGVPMRVGGGEATNVSAPRGCAPKVWEARRLQRLQTRRAGHRLVRRYAYRPGPLSAP